MIIDFHTHAFPVAIASRALSTLADAIQIKPLTDGTVTSLISRLNEYGVDRAIVCNIATNAKQTTNVNNFAIETLKNHGDRLTPLGSVNPEFVGASDEIERIHSSGIVGLKIHPDYMHRTIDDAFFDEIFDTAAQLDMFIITHAGFDVYSPQKVWANPDAVLRRLEKSPKTKLICAHMGGNMMWSEVYDKLLGKNLYIDTAFVSFTSVKREFAAKMMLKHDGDRILFGSDAPWCSSRETFEYVDSLAIPDDLKEKIFEGNAKRMLGM